MKRFASGWSRFNDLLGKTHIKKSVFFNGRTNKGVEKVKVLKISFRLL